jgi:hypothetical protein
MPKATLKAAPTSARPCTTRGASYYRDSLFPQTTRMSNHVKLHIPGPVEVSEKTFKAMTSPMIGHRGQGFKDLYAKMQPQLQTLLGTKQLVYLSTSSAWGVMEGAIRNLVAKKVLNCMCGAFSDKWLDVSQRCGKAGRRLAGAVGFAHSRRGSRQETRHRPVRRADLDSQRNVHRHDVAAARDRRAQEEVSRRDVHRGRRQLADRAADPVR